MRHQPEHNLKALEQIQGARIWLKPAYLNAGKNVKTLHQKHAPRKSDLLELEATSNCSGHRALENIPILLTHLPVIQSSSGGGVIGKETVAQLSSTGESLGSLTLEGEERI